MLRIVRARRICRWRLPDSGAELARLVGVSRNTINATVCRARKGKQVRWSRYAAVEIEEDDDERLENLL